ncbi:glycosyltransferase [Algoriphagus sp.]|uniref:glycosyltransferase n=1 Tax=Algoriphagus sp. TaxID=1872435 RepID=UPI003F6E49D3
MVIIHSGSPLKGLDGVEQIIVRQQKILFFEYRSLPDLSAFDIVVHMQNLRFLNLWILSLNLRREYKLVHWGIGTSSGNGLHQTKNLISRIRDLLTRFSDAQVLYSSFALPLFCSVVRKKTYIANNTVLSKLSQDFSTHEKDSVLFIGALNSRKGLEVLLEAFSKLLLKQPGRLKKLVLIGDGPMRSRLERMAEDLGIKENIRFVGNIDSEEDKIGYYRSAAISVSPYQAGLSVLECFSYGVPFIAFKNAISGGEHLNIVSGETGYLINSKDELVERLLEIDNQHSLAQKLGENAFKHYRSKRTMGNMVDSFFQAFDFAVNR